MADALTAFDTAVAVHLVGHVGTFGELARELATSSSQVHKAVRHLTVAGLLLPGTRSVNRSALLEFLVHGVKYAFPVQVGAPTRGVRTAHSGPALAGHFDDIDPIVWAAPDGEAVGREIEPLYPGAIHLRERAPDTYRLLTLIDAIRMGRARERNLAVEELERVLVRAV